MQAVSSRVRQSSTLDAATRHAIERLFAMATTSATALDPWGALRCVSRCGRALLERTGPSASADDLTRAFTAIRELRIITTDISNLQPGRLIRDLEAHLTARLSLPKMALIRLAQWRLADSDRLNSMMAGGRTWL